MFIGLEPVMPHNRIMKRVYLSVFALISLLAATPASAREMLASAWLDFREAKVRLLMAKPDAKAGPVLAALEIRLMTGFKTYWRTAGDSGVPPTFDFAKSTGLEGIEVKFPFPSVFDDGAGGKAWGYKQEVLYPITATRTNAGLLLDLRLDFAVCGTMCIPLGGEIRLDPASATRVPDDEAQALDLAIRMLPVVLEGDAKPALLARRLSPVEPPQWSLRVPYTGDISAFSAFPEARGFLEVTKTEPDGDGFVKITISGQAAPGSGGQFGPVRLTYGKPGAAYERMIDLDGAPASP